METTGLLDRAIAPLHWLERSRGWKRLGLALLYFLIAVVVGVFSWRELSLWRLPNIGEPFDTAKFGTVTVVDADNAMILYREAARRLIRSEQTNYRVTSPMAWDSTGWSTADPEVLRWAADNHAGFAIWIRATERPDSLLVQPRDRQVGADMATIHGLQEYARIALLEGSRLEVTGDLEESWVMYRHHLRSSRHVGRHGDLMQRYTGQVMLVKSRPSIQRWICNPKVTAPMLKRAIGDVEECISMTAPNSEMVRAEYFAWRSILTQPELWSKMGLEGPDEEGMWYNHFSFVPPARRFFLREPERTRRVVNLITAGILAQCDREPALRPKLFSAQQSIYEIAGTTPPVVASITPKELLAWADRSSVRSFPIPTAQMYARFDAERGILDTLMFTMAERAFEIEKGKPPSRYGDLLGGYLKSLPQGVEPGDPISAEADPSSKEGANP